MTWLTSWEGRFVSNKARRASELCTLVSPFPVVGEGNGVQAALTAAEARDPEQHQTRVILATCRLLRWAQS